MKMQNLKKSMLLIFGINIILFFISCGNKSNKTEFDQATFLDSVTSVAVNTEFAKQKTSSNLIMQNDSNEFLAQRKLILTGYATIEVNTISNLDNQIEQWVKNFGGYISWSDGNEKSFNVTVKIPSQKFYDAMNSARDFGTVKNYNINSTDVTDEYYDIDARIESKRILRDKLQGYLQQATNIKDIMEIERELNEVQSELESFEGRMKRLSNQIDFSEINLNFFMPQGKTNAGYQFPDYKKSFRQFAINVLSFLKTFVIALCYFVAFGIPLVAAFLFFFWLLFGKVGIIRKLFNKLKK